MPVQHARLVSSRLGWRRRRAPHARIVCLASTRRMRPRRRISGVGIVRVEHFSTHWVRNALLARPQRLRQNGVPILQTVPVRVAILIYGQTHRLGHR